MMMNIKKYKRIDLNLYINEKNMNYLSLSNYIWYDICKETMKKNIEIENENQIKHENKMKKNEMNIEKYEWNQSTIDELKENMIMMNQEKRW